MMEEHKNEPAQKVHRICSENIKLLLYDPERMKKTELKLSVDGTAKGPKGEIQKTSTADS